jgi:predicted FMN-binding regulatory protein PaiB
MAIKNEKIPSPQELKSQPQSFTEQELKELVDLRTEVSQLTATMGQLYVNKIKLEETELKLKKELKVLEEKEINIAKKLSDKYGNGSIDLSSGTFTPSK